MSKQELTTRYKIGDLDYVVTEMINHIISEYSKLTQQEYKTIHDWVGKVIQWKTKRETSTWTLPEN